MIGSFDHALGQSFIEPTQEVERDEYEMTECNCCGKEVRMIDSFTDMGNENRYSKQCINTGDALVYELENCPPPPSEWNKTIEYFDNLKNK